MAKSTINTVKKALEDVDNGAGCFISLVERAIKEEDISQSVRSPFSWPVRSPLYQEYQSSSEGLAFAFLTNEGIECWSVLKYLAKGRATPELIRQVYLTYSGLPIQR
ncbi:hypothetical protein J4438_00765 [Candidatus Woesearchaeota archaeon]|nr:hypothetical protein [Candidatus Woesearchaeota archaeon]